MGAVEEEEETEVLPQIFKTKKVFLRRFCSPTPFSLEDRGFGGTSGSPQTAGWWKKRVAEHRHFPFQTTGNTLNFCICTQKLF